MASRDLQLASIGALVFVPADMMTDAILEELDDWGEIGFVLLECGCLWRVDDVDDLPDHEHAG